MFDSKASKVRPGFIGKIRIPGSSQNYSCAVLNLRSMRLGLA